MKAIYLVVTVLVILSVMLAACGAQANPTATTGVTSVATSSGSETMEPGGTDEGTAQIPNTGNGTDTGNGTATGDETQSPGNGTDTTGNGNGTQIPNTGNGTPGITRTPSTSMTIKVSQDPQYGSFLVDDQGMSLYLFTDDTPNTSNCYDKCAEEWPPLVISGTGATAGDGVDASKLGTTTRSDGSTQVTYNGWPLYYFDEDLRPGDVKGQNDDQKWFLVSPAGDKILQ
jgi:predicted lipoprotein with Yx(FWY)xxD motif